MDNEEELSGVICVGAPIFNYTGYPCGAIWISGPKDRLSERGGEKYGEGDQGDCRGDLERTRI